MKRVPTVPSGLFSIHHRHWRVFPEFELNSSLFNMKNGVPHRGMVHFICSIKNRKHGDKRNKSQLVFQSVFLN
jgi:hypothetical protein